MTNHHWSKVKDRMRGTSNSREWDCQYVLIMDNTSGQNITFKGRELEKDRTKGYWYCNHMHRILTL